MDRYKRNATESPLLLLPAEVRNQIYSLTLGGHTIHVFDRSRGRASVYAICVEHEHHREMAESVGREEGSRPNVYATYSLRHLGCKRNTFPTFHTAVQLHLLRVCRQMHQEAALIPYAENKLTFNCTNSLRNFLRKVTLAQAQSIKSVTLVWDLQQRN